MNAFSTCLLQRGCSDLGLQTAVHLSLCTVNMLNGIHMFRTGVHFSSCAVNKPLKQPLQKHIDGASWKNQSFITHDSLSRQTCMHADFIYKHVTHTVEWPHFSAATVPSFIYASQLHLYAQQVKTDDIARSTEQMVQGHYTQASLAMTWAAAMLQCRNIS